MFKIPANSFFQAAFKRFLRMPVELALDFARGRYGLLVDSDHYVAYFEDPKISGLVGEIAYALPPLFASYLLVIRSDVTGE